ncbi:alpha/beta hydrolase [Sphingobacterium chungjuense]|uniref:alpha/beta hydrolase n=1 Tax=Sphingobacterium chungjuense TaxID=2675553 RepID=UPI001408A80D|nr:alpha/beta hydrolase [Sphingobacterium chungjuense]
MKSALLLVFATIFLITSCTKEEVIAYYPVDQDLVLRNVKYGEHTLQSMDVYLPAKRSVDHTKLIVYVHAGDWSSGDKDDVGLDDNSVGLLKAYFADYALFTLNHRLATGSNSITAKDAEMDILQAMDFIYEQANTYQISTDTYMAGLESGAQLATLFALKSAETSTRVKGSIAFSGAFDLLAIHNEATPAMKYTLQAYIGEAPHNQVSLYENASPIHYISSKSPSFLIIHDTNNSKYPISQAEAFAKRLIVYNVDHEIITYDSVKDSISTPDMENVFNKIKTFLGK